MATANTTVEHIINANVQPLARAVLGVAELIILRKCSGARAEICQEMVT